VVTGHDGNRSTLNEASPLLASARKQLVHEMFEAQVGRTPDAPAIDLADRRLAYRELNEHANTLAHHLRLLGTMPDACVALYLERSHELYSAVLAVLKAGGAYVYLDPQYPPARLRFMLKDSNASILVTHKELLERVGDVSVDVVLLDEDAQRLAERSALDPEPQAHQQNLAYVTYTSGSTGVPKGVAMTHAALVNLLDWQTTRAPRIPRRTLQFASMGFDVSFQEMFSTWTCGGTLVSCSAETRQDIPTLARFIKQERIERLFLPYLVLEALALEFQREDTWPVSVREIFAAGEQLRLSPAIRELVRRLPEGWLENQYGPSETHVATAWRIGDVNSAPALPPIGPPIDNAEVYLLDGQFTPVPVGEPGELYIGGAALARGYFNRRGMTAEAFVPNPLGKEGSRLYRTGDLGRWLDSGDIEFLGRIDHQVKVSGYRIELGEIESVLATHPAIKEVAVIAREDAPGDRRLVAYIVMNDMVADWSQVRDFLKQSLPEYMIPSAIVSLGALPLTVNGKLDRAALPAPSGERPDLASNYRVPGDDTEELLVSIWAEVLKLDEVGIDDDFFELGGNSLTATQVVSRLWGGRGVRITVRDIFETRTVAGLARRVGESYGGVAPWGPRVRRVDREQGAPLSYAQRRLWFLQEWAPSSAAYNIAVARRIVGVLDMEVFARALREVVRRHEALRTRFVVEDGVPRQLVDAQTPINLKIHDLVDLPRDLAEARARELIEEDLATPFALGSDLPFRASVFRLDAEDHVFSFIVHHIVFDGWSEDLLMRELSSLYGAFLRRVPSPLPSLSVQCADFAYWQNERLQDATLETEIDYWSEHLAHVHQVLDLPTDHVRPAVSSFQGDRLEFLIEPELAGSVRRIGLEVGATPFMTLLASFQTLLYRNAGQRNFVIGTPISERVLPELESLVGFFVNTLPVRADCSGDPTFLDLLGRVRDASLAAYAHEDVPFDKLLQRLKVERDLSRHPLFQVWFALHDQGETLSLPRAQVSAFEVHSRTARLDLSLEMTELVTRGLKGVFEYSTDLFDRSTIARLARQLPVLLQGIATDPNQRISRIPVLTKQDRIQLLVDWNSTSANYPRHMMAHELVEEQVERTPDAAAIIAEDERLSYRELNERANQVARHLRNFGVEPEARVGIVVERSPELIVGLLGVLKTGGTFVPLDPAHPRERLSYMLQDAGARILLTQKHLAGGLPRDSYQFVLLDDDWPVISEQPRRNLPRTARPDNLALVIYTSGSTGMPKGVGLTHRNIVHSTTARWSRYSRVETLLLSVSPAFDPFTGAVFWALSQGGAVVLPADSSAVDPGRLAELVERYSVSHCQNVPSLYGPMLEQEEAALASLRVCVVGGEQCGRRIVELHARLVPRAELVNEYGPTEATVWATAGSLTASSGHVTIGRPIANTQVYLLDSDLEPVPIGVAGELYVGGDGLARGYLNLPAVTADCFIPNTFADVPGSRLYRTGDLARYVENGEIEFLGRTDEQVKIRGYRVELSEIEHVLQSHPRVREAVLDVREFGEGDRRLIAFVVPGGAFSPNEELPQFLEKRLPSYMMPAVYVPIDVVPKSPNGKVDRRAIPLPVDLHQSRRDSSSDSSTPAERTLMRIWCALLGLDSVGVNDDFFALGGDSLTVIRMIPRVREEFGVKLGVRDIFETPTVAELALKVEHSADGSIAVEAPLGG